MQFVVRTFPEKHQWVSKFVLDCFEGQIISSAVVVVFVAMFLLQEWVIQNADLDADRRMDGMLEDVELPQAPPLRFVDDDPIEDAADQLVEQDVGRGRFNMEHAMERLIAAQHQIQAMMDGETDVEEDEATLPVLPEQAAVPFATASTRSATAGPSTLQRQLSSGVAFESTANSPDELHRRPNQGSAFGGIESPLLAARAETRDTLYYDPTTNRFQTNSNKGEESSSGRQQQPVITEGSDVIRSKSGRLFYWDDDETIPLTMQNVFVNKDGSDMTLNQQLARYDALLKTNDLAFSEVRRLPVKWKTSQLFAQAGLSNTTTTTPLLEGSAASSSGSSAATTATAATAATTGTAAETPTLPFNQEAVPNGAASTAEARLQQLRQRNRDLMAHVQQAAENVEAADGVRRLYQGGQGRPIVVMPRPVRAQDRIVAPPAPMQRPIVAPPPLPVAAAAAAPEDGARGGGGDADDDFDEMGAEELHGILEVIGMHGSYWILLQNSLLMSALICATLGVGVWVPYMIGKATLLMNLLWIVGFVMQGLSKLMDPLTDYLIDHVGPWVVLVTKKVGNLVAERIGPVVTKYFGGDETLQPLVNAAKQYVVPLWDALLEMVSPPSAGVVHVATSNVSTAAAAASTVLESATATTAIVTVGTTLVDESVNGTAAAAAAAAVEHDIVISPMKVVQHLMKRWTEIAYGNTSNDKFVAIMLGYVLLFFAAYWYMDQTRQAHGQTLSRVLRDILRQQGMILKIAFFVAIEMVVFPLFCGALISLSTLPVFKGATLASRFAFYMQAPNWSIIMHWIVGTAFMFNFSMFVGACRGVVRHGVMWFIRDPNDPGFHPIREILERPILMQLRKLGTGALMYMVLIVGGIAVTCYSIAFCLPGVFPLRLPVDRPLSDVPLDLLLFWLGPSLVRSLAISEWVTKLFKAWWRKMSQLLRLSSFMYGKDGERYPEEEGHVEYRTWRAWLMRVQPAIPDLYQSVEEVTAPDAEAVFVRDGGLYRVPNTDRILHLKDRRVLVPVDEEGSALDPMEDQPGEVDPMTDGQFHIRGIPRPPQDPKLDTVIVYGPPDFKRRLLAFVVLLWASVMVFCAATVLLPIVTGRLFATWYLGNETLHDSITFFWGACILGLTWFMTDRVTKAIHFLADNDQNIRVENGVLVQSTLLVDKIRIKAHAVGAALWEHVKLAGRTLFFMVTLGVLVPLMTTLVLELYVFLPLRRMLSEEEPGINFFLDWAFGFTFIRTVLHTLFLMQEVGLAAQPDAGFMAEVNRQLVVPPMLQWDVSAVARLLLMPYLSSAVALLSAPTILAKVLTLVLSLDEVTQARLYRQIHPISMFVFVIFFGTQQSYRVISRWSQYVRDEEYLLGRQLHNLEEEGVEVEEEGHRAAGEDRGTNPSATNALAAAEARQAPAATAVAAGPAASETTEESKEPTEFQARVINRMDGKMFTSPSSELSMRVPRPPSETMMMGRRLGAGAEGSSSSAATAFVTEEATGVHGGIGSRNRDTALRRRFQKMWEDPELTPAAGSDDDLAQATERLELAPRAGFWKRVGLSSRSSKSSKGYADASDDGGDEESDDEEEEDRRPSFLDKGKGKSSASMSNNVHDPWAGSSSSTTSEMSSGSFSSKSAAEEVEVLRPIYEGGYGDDVEGDSIAARTRLRRSQRLQAMGSRRSSSSSMGY
ncbi:hypothetical protein DFQ27_001501 [Actinomortierella ambigua]|uniref:RING-type E3 ubiquitin transferase n=1 Tax=Actinomortierella ambigua TaxID=1343610 RepID=A0A9P6QA60_9FUNG|nr:hypothetical protein DFQ27_001501 [Actinomortierella ambigua]